MLLTSVFLSSTFLFRVEPNVRKAAMAMSAMTATTMMYSTMFAPRLSLMRARIFSIVLTSLLLSYAVVFQVARPDPARGLGEVSSWEWGEDGGLGPFVIGDQGGSEREDRDRESDRDRRDHHQVLDHDGAALVPKQASSSCPF